LVFDPRPAHLVFEFFVFIFQLFLKRVVAQVLLFEITRTKARHKRLRDILLPTPAQCLNVISDGRLVVGYPSGFAVYSLMGDQHPMSLVQSEHPSISFIAHHPLDALRAVEINSQEFLLVFSTLAIYVDYQGRKSREKEIMYPAPPLAIGTIFHPAVSNNSFLITCILFLFMFGFCATTSQLRRPFADLL
jgi:hypothetical protein